MSYDIIIRVIGTKPQTDKEAQAEMKALSELAKFAAGGLITNSGKNALASKATGNVKKRTSTRGRRRARHVR